MVLGFLTASGVLDGAFDFLERTLSTSKSLGLDDGKPRDDKMQASSI